MDPTSNNKTDSAPQSIYNHLSLKAKRVFYVLPIVMLGLLTLSFTAYKYINDVIEQQLADSMLHSVGKSAESINRWLSTIMIEPETIATTTAATQITPPLISRTTGIPTIYIVSPILDETNRPQGLVGAGISLQYIQKIVQ
ncbi:PDC sensor domain-containing protein [Desulfopila sp. IMCC35008]|uniref:PDC sensor domain-containing protein n=1 Tax=Desulfopila sp. IMCC35008 TaxID=2653858 RepID=UPI0013D6F24D|nr:PDC sensor domain-containing protein [Desulfopila sp. IMCC35008]